MAATKEVGVWYKLDPPLVIEGDGSSMWGDSAGAYTVTRVMLAYVSDEGGTFGELQAEGEGLDWFQYTDRAIEATMHDLLPVISELLGAEVTRISWSEQGMQPDRGWSFDITFKEVDDARLSSNA